ncbi:hypothetical protein PWG71_09225 [Nocardiopsis sp. N85]|uniref:esterase/lipase family protein n=1 Tax=Nocardiopsis sp. N85 TaxID=3029400 RepID=UPI00237F32C9|nr:hypothetical protein [Nocardiopsis sp. N85]MDE3721569.1 hypothetical protein [Nocardiopsis sp. N85]
MSDTQQPPVEPLGLLFPSPGRLEPAPAPNEVWRLPGGIAWIHLAKGHRGLTRPVLLSDGFETGPSDLEELWQGLERGDHPFITELRRRGHDLVLVGYDERSASLLDNARTVREAVLRTIAQRSGSEPLVVGGLSMGGLITRYALAKLEHEGIDHQTATYLSIDTPHRGAWVPIGIQKLAHLLTATPALSAQINSPAARELLWRHVATVDAEPAEDARRTEFLTALRQVGDWPRVPRLLGVANGRGDGARSGVSPGTEALRVTGGWFAGTTLYTQAEGDKQLVAQLKGRLTEHESRTTGLSALDGAPGGTLESYGLAADRLKATGPIEVSVRKVCFVPTVSAVSIGELDDPYANVGALGAERSDLDEFLVADTDEPHTHMSEAAGTWILDRLPN